MSSSPPQASSYFASPASALTLLAPSALALLAAWAGAPLALGLAVQLLLDPGLVAAMGAGSHLRPGEDPAAHVWFFYALAGARALTFALGRALPGARNKGARVALAFAVATLATWLWPGAREAAAPRHAAAGVGLLGVALDHAIAGRLGALRAVVRVLDADDLDASFLEVGAELSP